MATPATRTRLTALLTSTALSAVVLSATLVTGPVAHASGVDTAPTPASDVVAVAPVQSRGSGPAAASSPGTTNPVITKVIPTNATWLATVNAYRRQAGLAAVRSNTGALNGVRAHACWMIRNDISHTPQQGTSGYTDIGARAAAASNLAVSNTSSTSDKEMIDLWMTAPFHAIGILRPTLQWVSYGRCEGNGPYWRSAAALNVLDGIDNTRMRPTTPIVWPGNGSTTPLTTFVREVPNPVEMCGWSGEAGLPVIAMMPTTVSVKPIAVMTGPNGRLLETCTLWKGNAIGAQSLLAGENAFVVMPRKPLTAGRHTVTALVNGRTLSWSFTVRP